MAGLFCCTGACGVVAIGTTSVQRHWPALGATAPTIEATIVPPGCPKAYKFSVTNNAGHLGITVADTTLSGGFWLHWPTTDKPNGTTNVLALINANGNATLRLTTAGVVSLQVSAGPLSNGPTISLDTWYWVTWKIDSSGATTTVTATVYDEDGTVVGSEWSASNTQATANVTSIRLGQQVSVTGTIYIGGIYHDDDTATYPHGRKNVVAMFPTGDGAHSTGVGVFLTDAGGAITDVTTDAWASLPTTDIVGSSEHVRQTVSASTAYLEFAFSGAPSGTADVVTATCNLLSQGTGPHTQKFAINDNGTIADAVAATDFSQTTDSYPTKSYAVAPSSGAWTEAVLNAIRFRWGYGASFPDNAVLAGMILEVATAADVAATNAAAGVAAGTGLAEF